MVRYASSFGWLAAIDGTVQNEDADADAKRNGRYEEEEGVA